MHTIEQKIKRYAEKQKSMTCTQEKKAGNRNCP